MILVVEAGYQGWVAFWANSTLPLATSTRSSASARAGEKPNALAAPAVSTSARVRMAADFRENIRARDSVSGLGMASFPAAKSTLKRTRRQKQKGCSLPELPFAGPSGERKRQKFGRTTTRMVRW